MADTLLTSDPNDFTDKYNTKLTPEEEKKFNQWAVTMKKTKDTRDYDLRGAWQELQKSGGSVAPNEHLTDKYKKPNHPTFSDESIYHGADGQQGGKWAQKADGTHSFTPTNTNLRYRNVDELKKYFAEYEKGVELNMQSMFPSILYGAGVK